MYVLFGHVLHASGYRATLTDKSFYKLTPQDDTEYVLNKHERLWQEEVRKGSLRCVLFQ